MTQKVRSARGEMVDFDLLRIKEQIAARPTTNDVRARQDFIESKIRRRLKKPVYPKAETTVTVEPKMPGAVDVVDDSVDAVAADSQPKLKQKARPRQ